MSEVRSQKVFTGTNAKRLALDTTNLEHTDAFVESDTGDEYEWSGADWYQTKTGGIATTLGSGSGVPASFTKMTTNGLTETISKGSLHKLATFPRIGNEHVESSREIQGVVSSGNIVGQIFKASKDNISALILTLESAGGVAVDDFDSYANDAALQAVWAASGVLATLDLVNFQSSPQAMKLPTTNTSDTWETTAAPTDYTGYTGKFSAYFTHTFAQQQIAVYIEDNVGNSKSFLLIQDGAGIWCDCEVAEGGMVEDPGNGADTDTANIVKIGYEVILKRTGGSVTIDDLLSVPPPGFLEVKLWDMGTTIPVSATTSINDGTQYEKIGAGEASSFVIDLQGGTRLYHFHEFTAGMNKSLPSHESLNIGNYYLIELKHIDTDVSVYGPDTSFSINYYTNGFAFTAPDEATAITATGEFSDIMFAIMSTQDIYMTRSSWRFDAAPNGDSSISVFLEDNDMKVTDAVVDHERSPEQEFASDLSNRPMFLEDGAKVEYYYSDDFTDSVSKITSEITFYYVPPVVNG